MRPYTSPKVLTHCHNGENNQVKCFFHPLTLLHSTVQKGISCMTVLQLL